MGGRGCSPQQSFVLQIDDFEATRHERLDQISPQLIRAKKRLQDISEPRRQCLQELALQKELVGWLHEALGGTGELGFRCCQVGLLNWRPSHLHREGASVGGQCLPPGPQRVCLRLASQGSG